MYLCKYFSQTVEYICAMESQFLFVYLQRQGKKHADVKPKVRTCYESL